PVLHLARPVEVRPRRHRKIFKTQHPTPRCGGAALNTEEVKTAEYPSRYSCYAERLKFNIAASTELGVVGVCYGKRRVKEDATQLQGSIHAFAIAGTHKPKRSC